MSMLTRDLVVIEAPGKLRQLNRVLDAIGLRATAIATLGHVLESPPRLRPLEIRRDATSGDYVETLRVPPKPDAYARLELELRALRGRLIIATDDDQEGHAIAEDVAAIARRLRPELTPLRVLAQAITQDAFRSALAQAQPLVRQSAYPAIARRLADRTIASAFSRPTDGVVVGRVATAIAGLARDGALPCGIVTLEVPASGGGRPFVASTHVHSAAEAAALIQAAAHVAAMPSQGPAVACDLAQPPTHADFLMAMGEGARLSLAQAAQVLQGLYEDGIVSYPRTAGQHYKAHTRARLAQLAKTHGVRAAAESTASPVLAHGHEPLHVVDAQAITRLPLSRPANLQRNDRDVALAWISRRMFDALVVVRRESGDAASLPPALASLQWSRELGATPAWHRRPQPGLHPFTREQSLLQGMVDAGIGRASTYVAHVAKAIDRGIVAPNNQLAAEGRRVLAAAPAELSRPEVARAIELECEQAANQGVGPTVDRLLALAVGRQTSLLERFAVLLQPHELEEPTHALVP